ncbi:aldo/keto reductase [Clostridium sp. D33t1_170424_F3]|uniref:aldo/keto reductase n=1 Tax=Clostridium sp. D33t1_170424_F3 TaxID=2787099 RepID=UPI0018A9155C|nr:aldo/keto reductase [Clostridium sp. D33t1_170424_F3]
MLRKLLSFILLLTISFSLVACSSNKTNLSKEHQDPTSKAEDVESLTPTEGIENKPTKEENKVLVVYFSATGTTKTLAEYSADILDADIYEIVPEIPYTEADLAYYTGGRADKEQNDPTARPAISGSVKNMEQYDTVLLGYPIWHGQAPRIISTFLESYDFSGKTILPFCTSHSSGIGSSAAELQSLAENAKWLEGKRFSADTSKEDIAAWLEGNGLHKTSTAQVGKFDFEKHTVLLNSGYEMPIMGLGTYSLSDEDCYNSVTTLLENGGRLIDTAYMYHNEAAVGKAVRESSVPREEIFVITKLYPNQFSDAESAIDEALERMGLDYVDMMLLHHPGTDDVAAYKAMEQAVKDGKIRSIGLSNWYVEELEDFLPQVSITPALIQNEIHPYYQENDVIPYIQEKGIVVQGWYPLGGRGHTAELLGDNTISAIAKVHGVSSAQVILRWNLQKGVIVIPGSGNPDHIKENLDLFGFELTDEEMKQINALDRNEKHDWY